MDEKDIKNQATLASLSKEQLNVLASDIRADILSVCLHNGGHLSSNLGVVELTISLLRHFDYRKNDILFDVGHQSYTYKILTGRNISNIRKTGGTAPFNLREESPYDRYSNGHAGDCLGTAIGMAEAKKQNGDDSFTIAVIGDASMENGMSMEALDYLSKRQDLKNLIVILNDNGMAISKNNGRISHQMMKLRNSRFYFRTSNYLGRTMSKHRITWKIFLGLRGLKDHMKRFFIQSTVFEDLGLKYVGPYDGQDFDSLDLAFEKATVLSKKAPLILHILTHKGFGYAPAQNDEKGVYHGVSSDFDSEASTFPRIPDFATIKGDALLRQMEKDPAIEVISPAMELNSGLGNIFRKYPERSFDVGIAEENALLMASGLAIQGKHPVVDIYSTFLQRSYDELIENVIRQHISVLFLVDRAGLVGEDGSSHQGIYDVGFIKTVPGSKIYFPYTENQIQTLIDFDFKRPGGTFIRFPKGKPVYLSEEPKLEGNNSYTVMNLRPENGTYVLAIGPYGYELLSSLGSSRLNKIMLVDLLPEENVLENLGIFSAQRLYLYDPYSTLDGTASYLSEVLLKHGFKGEFISYAFERKLVPFGQIKDLLKKESLDPLSVAEKIEKECPHD